MKIPGKKTLKPLVLFLIGIILISLSFIFWYFMVSPVCGLAQYGFSYPKTSKTINTTQTILLYFGSIYFEQRYHYNRSRPIDYSFNLFLDVETTVGGPIEVTVYVRSDRVDGASTNATHNRIICNTTLYNLDSSLHPPKAIVKTNIGSKISASLLDAFTGGTTPYMIIRNLGNNATTVSYRYNFIGQYRSSNGVTLIMFIIGAVIAAVEGVVLLKMVIKRLRQR